MRQIYRIVLKRSFTLSCEYPCLNKTWMIAPLEYPLERLVMTYRLNMLFSDAWLLLNALW